MKYLVLILVLLLSGCAAHKPSVWTQVPTAGQLLARMELAAGNNRALDIEATVYLTVAEKSVSTHQFLLAEKPDRLRSDVLTGFGQLVLQMASDGETLSVFLNTSVPGRYYTGPASYENMVRFSRIPLRIDDLLGLLLHTPPVIAFRSSVVALRNDLVVLTLRNDGQQQDIFWDQQMQVVRVDYYRGGDLQLSGQYKNFSDAEQFPQGIRIEVPQQQTVISLSAKQVVLNPAIASERFRLKVPAGAEFEQLL